jgi:signal transduction histidine kinase
VLSSLGALTATRFTLGALTGRPTSSRTVVFDLLLATECVVGRILVAKIREQAEALDRAHDQSERSSAQLAEEREQVRHRRLVHDRVLQSLEATAQGWDVDDRELHERLRLDAAYVERLAHDGTATAPGLVVAFERLVHELGQQGLEVRLAVVGTAAEPADAVVDALEGATREALVNVVKHAGVDHASVEVERAPDAVTVAITDDGSGIDPARGEGFGLAHSIRGRIETIGGRADLRSGPEGTRVTLWAPA